MFCFLIKKIFATQNEAPKIKMEAINQMNLKIKDSFIVQIKKETVEIEKQAVEPVFVIKKEKAEKLNVEPQHGIDNSKECKENKEYKENQIQKRLVQTICTQNRVSVQDGRKQKETNKLGAVKNKNIRIKKEPKKKEFGQQDLLKKESEQNQFEKKESGQQDLLKKEFEKNQFEKKEFVKKESVKKEKKEKIKKERIKKESVKKPKPPSVHEAPFFCEGFVFANHPTITGIAGMDEVGKGSWAGPVEVCVCVVERGAPLIPNVRDSKKYSADGKMRAKVAQQLRAAPGHFFYTVQKDVASIDRQGVDHAISQAMTEAVQGIIGKAQFLFIDGNKVPETLLQHPDIATISVVKGDRMVYAIAAASIVAKVERDALMVAYAKEYPHYNWENNKGYGGISTHKHSQGIALYGLTPLHRRSLLVIQRFIKTGKFSTKREEEEAKNGCL
jgi:ribonuclease HII